MIPHLRVYIFGIFFATCLVCLSGIFTHSLATSGHPVHINEDDTLYVKELLLSRDVIEREPVDVVQSFSMDDERAWGFAVIHSTYRMHTLTFKWYYEDEEYFTFDSQVGESPNWRTYSSVGLQPGSWRVELYNEYDEMLKEVRFHVSE